jgi:hypothetical protein
MNRVISEKLKGKDMATLKPLLAKQMGEEAEEALRESKEKYRTILENIKDGYFEVGIAGNFAFSKDSVCRVGKELADQLKILRPGIKVLYASGYTDNAIVHHGVLEPGIHFLQKPFSPKTLSRKVGEVLDREGN